MNKNTQVENISMLNDAKEKEACIAHRMNLGQALSDSVLGQPSNTSGDQSSSVLNLAFAME